MTKHPNPDMPHRLTQGLVRLAYAIKSEAWLQADRKGLSGTQARIVDFLASRGAQSLNEIAAHLSVTAATASDSVSNLAEKGLVTKEAAEDDARRKVIALSTKGRKEARGHADWSEFLTSAIATLEPKDQAQMLRLVSQIIANLQDAGQIPVTRMCFSCQFFQPDLHKGQPKPHHCAFVDAAIGPEDLRIDCGEFELKKRGSSS